MLHRNIFLFFCLCIAGCGDEAVLVSEQVFFAEGGERVEAPGISEVPVALQDVLWGDRDKMIASLAVAMEAEDTERVDLLIRIIHLRDMQQAYYTKYIDAGGIAIVGNSEVHDWYFEAAKDIVLMMTAKHPRLREVLSPGYLHRFRWAQALLAEGTMTGQRQILVFGQLACGLAFVPEVRWGVRGAGWCSTHYCISSVYAGSPHAPRQHGLYAQYPMETFVHEFAHAIDSAMPLLEGPDGRHQDFILQDRSDFDDRLARIYKAAHAAGTWHGLYADTNKGEYWAEGVRMWFYDIGPGREFETYAAFASRDPALFALLDAWFPRVSFYEKY